MQNSIQPFILVVGGSDTGRTPMALALLQRHMQSHYPNWRIESAGVTSHDDEPPEAEACSAMFHFEQDITDHVARPLSATLAQSATVIVAIDTGISHVLCSLHPALTARIVTLGTLAGTQRDIPDPFRMHVATWIAYAKEINDMWRKGLHRLIEMVQTHYATDVANVVMAPDTPLETINSTLDTAQHHTISVTPWGVAYLQQKDETVNDELVQERAHHSEQCQRILTMVRDMPGVIEWRTAHKHVSHAVQTMSNIIIGANDNVQPYANLLMVLLGMVAKETPSSQQLTVLLDATRRIATPIDQHTVMELSHLFNTWSEQL